ncbi:MAG: hypothetical protein WCI92_10215 [Bacteroidota bacterium]
MKTSVIISSIAAICLMTSFAELSNNSRSDLNSGTSQFNVNNVSAGDTYALVTGPNNASERKNEANTSATVDADNDFSYLKFDVAEYSKTAAPVMEVPMSMPSKSDSDFPYLKFDVNRYNSDGTLTEDSSLALPLNENTPADATSATTPLNEFEYLKFDISKFSKQNASSDLQVTNESAGVQTSGNELNSTSARDCEYLKFDVDYYSSPSTDNINREELPVNE